MTDQLSCFFFFFWLGFVLRSQQIKWLYVVTTRHIHMDGDEETTAKQMEEQIFFLYQKAGLL